LTPNRDGVGSRTPDQPQVTALVTAESPRRRTLGRPEQLALFAGLARAAAAPRVALAAA
jgi:hypothetical protein